MSWESTAEYYRLINELVAERLGGLHSADPVLRSVDFAELEAAGAELLVLCTNTMHKVADAIENTVDVPLLHVIDAGAAGIVLGCTEKARP